MSIDISQFLDTFYEESFEGLDTMETELLALKPGEADGESINTIFRAAHSIKGGSGTFGLGAVSDFTHVLETLLDQMRDGRREVTQAAVELMLASVDVLRDMLNALRDGSDIDSDRVNEVHGQLEALLQGDAAPQTEQADAQPLTTDAQAASVANGWTVHFKPFAHLFKTGNDPVRIIRELADLGSMQASVDLTALPEFDLLDPEECYLAWRINLDGDISEAQIRDVFVWVEDDCDLSVEACAAPPEASDSKAHLEQGEAPGGNDAGAVEIQADETRARETVQQPQAGAEQAKSQTAAPATKKQANAESGSIRVGIDKVDALINMVGELVITQSMLNQLGEEFTMDRVQKLQEGLTELERHTRELQENVMRIRMLPISFSFNRFPRLVHDLSTKLDKKVELKMSGEQTELDKTVMEKIGDPLVHLVRNSLDHGIESPEERQAKGKPETAPCISTPIIRAATSLSRFMTTGPVWMPSAYVPRPSRRAWLMSMKSCHTTRSMT